MKLRIYADIIDSHDLVSASTCAELAEDALCTYLKKHDTDETLASMSAFDLPDLIRVASAAATARAMVEVALALREVADGSQ